MKTYFCIFIFLLFLFRINAQDTTRVLFIGNSFTYGSNMPQLFKNFADSAHIHVTIAMHAPGGVSVGDTAQGTMAHMNNPVLFQLIRSKKWDFAVIQDNQGRFVQDSGVFPAKSKVVQGHLNIMDSVKANNSCAKIILFGGWAWKYGMPPVGNTGIECIQRILCNYRVLNDTMKEVIAPIGEAWIKASQFLPAVNLWDTDDAHPSYDGSYLTASVIFSTIFNLPALLNSYDGANTPLIASKLRAFGDSAVFLPEFHKKYNLGGYKKLTLQYSNGQLTVPGSFINYNWYKDRVFVGKSTALTLAANGVYRAEVTETDGCVLKTCNYSELTTGIEQVPVAGNISVFPNPVTDGKFFIRGRLDMESIELSSVSGISEKITHSSSTGVVCISTTGLKPGCYTLKFTSKDQTFHKKIIISN